MLLEASPEAPDTTPDNSSVVSAVLVRVVAAASSSVASDETLSTIEPTASWKPDARRNRSSLRWEDRDCWSASCSARSRSVSIMLSLKIRAAPAISPISSRRISPGSAMLKSPAASLVSARVIADIGCEMARPSRNDSAHIASAASAIALTIRVFIASRNIASEASAMPVSRSISEIACATFGSRPRKMVARSASEPIISCAAVTQLEKSRLYLSRLSEIFSCTSYGRSISVSTIVNATMAFLNSAA